MATGPYRLTLSYRGTAYAGWQRQRNAVTVQERVEEAIALLERARQLSRARRRLAGAVKSSIDRESGAT